MRSKTIIAQRKTALESVRSIARIRRVSVINCNGEYFLDWIVSKSPLPPFTKGGVSINGKKAMRK